MIKRGMSAWSEEICGIYEVNVLAVLTGIIFCLCEMGVWSLKSCNIKQIILYNIDKNL